MLKVQKPVWPLATALLVLMLNVFLISPRFNALFGPVVGNISYIGIRIVTLLALSFYLAKYCQKVRYQVVATASFVAFLDQCVFKGVLFFFEVRSNPQIFPDGTLGNVLFAFLMSYILFLPFIILIAFAGTELTRFKQDWMRNQKNTPAG
jgi:hypothetical protein